MIQNNGWILRASQQRALDTASITAGTSAETLMESAGCNSAKWILDRIRPKSAVVLAGPGGNGGDAFVVARQLFREGVTVQAFSLCSIESCSPLTQMMAGRLTDLSDTIHIASLEIEPLQHALGKVDCVVDGLFGSGLSRKLAEADASICRLLNDWSGVTVSLDVPSGVDSDAGILPGSAVRADFTLAMAFHKPCHWLYPAAGFCGDVHTVGVDYPDKALADVVPAFRVIRREVVAKMLPSRSPTGHKGTFGHVLIVAGSRGMTGAAILCARGALRIGSGLVTVAVPEAIAPVIQAAVPEAITLPLPGHQGRLDDSSVLDLLLPAMQRASVIALGPGLGRNPATLEVVKRIVEASVQPLVIDADAIHGLVRQDQLIASLAGRAVLTPHPGEFASLIGSTSSDVDAQRLDRVAAFIAKHGVHLLLKGRPTVIGLADRSVIVNPSGNAGLATGGSGDVLTGMISGLIAGGSSLDSAAVAAPYIHGLTADCWAMTHSERSLTPSDILDHLPRVLKELEL